MGNRALRVQGYAIFAWAVLVTSSAAWAGADAILVQGRPLATGVRIVAIEGVELRYRLASEREIRRAIGEIEYVQIDGWDTFNRAERDRRDGSLRQAVFAYERALQELDARDTEADAEASSLSRADRLLLVRCRLLTAQDALGRFDEAVEHYLAIVSQLPEAHEKLRPGNLPTARSTFLATARASVTTALDRIEDPGTRASLEGWLATWPDRPPRAEPPGPRSADEASAAPADDEAEARLAPIRAALENIHVLVESGRFAEALERIAPLHGPSAGALRAELHYWEGRARFGLSAEQGGEAPEAALSRAGLAFMRVVIHFPEHPRAAESLYRAAAVCRAEERADLAERLEAELAARYPVTSPWVQRVRRQGATPVPDR